jgi:hypothetical protein
LNKKRDSVVALLVVLSICLLLRLAQFLPPEELQKIKVDSPISFIYNALQLGMSRAEVRPYMRFAWRRYECKFGDSVREVYLFGPRGRVSESHVIELFFDEQDGVERLTLVGDVDYYELSLPVSDDCDIYEAPWETPWPNLYLVIPPAR